MASRAPQVEDAQVDGLHLVMRGYTGEHRMLISDVLPSEVWSHALHFAKANGHTVPGAYAARAVAAMKGVNVTPDYQTFIKASLAHKRAASKILGMRKMVGQWGRFNDLPVYCTAPIAASGVQSEELNRLIVEYAAVFSAGVCNLRETAAPAIRTLIEVTKPGKRDRAPDLRALACTYSASWSGFDGLISMNVEEWVEWARAAERHASAIDAQREANPDVVKRWWS